VHSSVASRHAPRLLEVDFVARSGESRDGILR
jgi:hypothetical protein